MTSISLNQLFAKKKCICKGCEKEYESNTNMKYCDICEDIQQEIMLKTVMLNTWSKLYMLVTYKVKISKHDINCKKCDPNNNEIQKFYTTLKLPLLRKFKSHCIGPTGEIISPIMSEYLHKYCKDDDTLCRCDRKRTYTIVNMKIVMDN